MSGGVITPGLSTPQTLLPLAEATVDPQVLENLKQQPGAAPLKGKVDPNAFVDIVSTLNTGAPSGEVAQNLLAGTGELGSSAAAEGFQALSASININLLNDAAGLGEVGGEALALHFAPIQLVDAGSAFTKIANLLEEGVPPKLEWQGEKALGMLEVLTSPPKIQMQVDAKLLGALKSSMEIVRDSIEPAGTGKTDDQRVLDGEVVIPDSKVLSAEQAFAQVLGPFSNADVETLMIIVMNEANKDNNEDLKSIMAEMKAVTETKKAIREYTTWMRQVKAAWEKEALGEYYKRQASGQSPPSETFEQFMSGLTLTLPTQTFKPNAYGSSDSAGGSFPYPSPDSIDFNFADYKSPGQIQEENRKIQEAQQAAASGGAGAVDPLDAAAAIEKAKDYGIDPEDIQRFWSLYNALKADPNFANMPDFDTWLKAGPGATVADGPGLAPGQDANVSSANMTAVDNFIGKLEELDRLRTAENQANLDGLKADLAEIENMKNKSPEELAAYLQQKLEQSDNPELKAYIESLPPKAGDVIGGHWDTNAFPPKWVEEKATGTVKEKVAQLVKDIVMAKTKVEHLKQEGYSTVAAEQELAAKLENLQKLAGLVEDDPALKAALACTIQDELEATAAHFSNSFNANNYRTGGGGPADIGGHNVEAGSSGGAADHGRDHYDLAVGGFGYVDRAALGAIASELQSLAAGDGELVEGLSVDGAIDAASEGINTQIGELTNEDGSLRPTEYGTMASEWREARTQMQAEGRPKLKAEEGKEGSENSAAIDLTDGSGGASIPRFVGAGPGHPYEVQTNMRTMSIKELDAEIESSKNSLDSLSEMSEEISLRLQMKMDLKSRLMTTLSNMLSKMSKTSEGITQNLK